MNNKHIILCCLLICLCVPVIIHAKIAYNGVSGLYVMDDDGSNVQKLTTDPSTMPEWSPDGKQIAFSRHLGNDPRGLQIFDIYIINSDGTGERKLTNEVSIDYTPTWSPDGKYIVYDSNRLAKLGEVENDLWRINVATGNLRRLTRIADWRIAFPSWSPDGEYIAYQRGADIYLMRADGTGRHKNIGRGERPNWSPDSQSVVCSQRRRDEARNFVTDIVVIYSIKTGLHQILDIPDDVVIHSTCFMGNKYVLISLRHWDKEKPYGTKFDIYRYHLVTGEIVNLTNTPAADEYGMDWISDDVLPVSPKSKITLTWGTLKQ